ncbi:MAG: phosphoribosylglycinamide formyltransferase [Janthinobacterium lividum]
MSAESLRVGVLGSTRGTALQGVLDALEDGTLSDVELALVVSDKPGAHILERAGDAGFDTLHLSPTGLEREIYDAEVTAAFEEAQVDLILMIGYMRIVTRGFVEDWRGRLLNVHPSLLPAFAGLMNRRVHEAVLASGVHETGCTVHQVTEDVDAGEIVLQMRCPVLEGDTVESLKDRVQALEQQAFVEALQNWPRENRAK